jgi:uncharacterized glyoxalase superfamily protein PhnB
MALDAIGVVVEDIERTREFYARLGLEVPADSAGHGHVEVTLAGGLRLMFDTVETMHSFDPDWTAPVGSPRTTFAFSFATPGEVDAKFDELVSAGGQPHKPPWDAFWGMRYAVLRDPDGNEIALFANLESG